jgi:hypothetical protein
LITQIVGTQLIPIRRVPEKEEFSDADADPEKAST